jgi:hypothetical protein
MKLRNFVFSKSIVVDKNQDLDIADKRLPFMISRTSECGWTSISTVWSDIHVKGYFEDNEIARDISEGTKVLTLWSYNSGKFAGHMLHENNQLVERSISQYGQETSASIEPLPGRILKSEKAFGRLWELMKLCSPEVQTPSFSTGEIFVAYVARYLKLPWRLVDEYDLLDGEGAIFVDQEGEYLEASAAGSICLLFQER